MRDIAIATIKARKSAFVGVFVAVLCASALVTALGVLFESGIRAGVDPQRYAGATVVVGARQEFPVHEDIDLPYSERVPLPADVVDRVSRVSDVDRAVGDLSVPVGIVANGQTLATVDDRQVLGHGWSSAVLTPFTIRDGAPPGDPGAVVLDAGLAARTGVRVGDRIDVAVGSIPERYTVAGIANQSLGRSPALFFTDERARELSGHPGQVDAVGVLGRPGTDPDTLAARITEALQGIAVTTYTGHDRGDVEFLDVGQARSMLAILSLSFAGIAIVIAMFVLASTLALSIAQRRREIALLRAIGATRRQIHRMVGSEILLVAGVAAVAGAGPGIGVAFLLRAGFAKGGLLPADFTLAVSPLPALAAMLLCVATARIAGWLAARRPARINPVAALGEAAVEPKRLSRVRVLLGWLAAGLGLATSGVPLLVPGEAAVAGAASSALLLIMSIALLGPRLVGATVRVLGRSRRVGASVSGYLAVANTGANSRRLAGAVTPLVLAVAIASVQIFNQTTLAAAAADQADVGVVADYVVSGSGSGLAPGITGVVRDVEGVDVAIPVVRSQVFVPYLEAGDEQVATYAAQGVVPERLASVLDLEPRAGSLDELHGETVALSQLSAETLGVDVGETIALRLGDGTALRPRVVAIYGRGLGFGDVTLPHELLVAHTSTRLDDSILVRADRGTDLPAVGAALRGLATAHPGLVVLDRDGLSAAGQAQRDADSWTSLIVLLVLLSYIGIAVVNTLVMATADRAREFALLRLVGASRRQVARMMRVESAIVVGIAAVVGTLVALPPLVGMSIGLTESPLPSIPPLIFAGIIAGTAALGLLAIGLPTRIAMRARPVDVIGNDGW